MKQEKDLTIEQYHAKKEREEKAGKTFVWIIGIGTILASLGSLLLDSNSMLDLVVLFTCIVASVMLLCGFSWARVFLAILSAWNAVWTLFAVIVVFPLDILAGDSLSSDEIVLFVLYTITFLWYLFGTLALFLHKGVKEHMYNTRNW